MLLRHLKKSGFTSASENIVAAFLSPPGLVKKASRKGFDSQKVVCQVASYDGIEMGYGKNGIRQNITIYNYSFCRLLTVML